MREHLAVLGSDFRTGVHPERLARWAGEPAKPFAAWRRILALLLSLAGAATLLWWLGTDFADPNARLTLIVVGAVEVVFGFGLRAQILSIISAVEEPAHDLDLLSGILATLETQQFDSPQSESPS